MENLSERQLLILKHIIDEYIETAEPVGSVHLEKKFPSLAVSPATIRNEMAYLVRKGFLKQSHTSSGRIPTPQALKLYVHHLMKPKALSVTDEVGIKAKISDYKQELDKALREATRDLAHRTKSLAVAIDNDQNIYSSGIANILELPEFYDIDLTKTVLSLIEEFDLFNKILSSAPNERHVHILMGKELGNNYLEPCGLIFSRFGEDNTKYHGAIGVLGSYRCQYPVIIPTVEYYGNVIDEVLATW